MCGIFGIVDCPPVDEKLFKSSLDLLKHRGPDSTRIRLWDTVAFGFTRLAIQDLTEAGDQPMMHPSEPVTVVFNGEIYNYRILRDELIKEGATFASQSDTEVILHGYNIWGWEKTLSRLEGMFGMALYDKKKSVVFLARCRFGMKPLFYTEYNSGIVFSSEIKSILNYTGKREIDFFSSLNPLFTTGLSPKGKTVFKGVRQLEAGTYLKYNLPKRTSEKKRYFHLSEWVSEDQYKELDGYSHSKMLTLYEETFNCSVKQHLLSDAPLASLFSAGLDSSLITAIASRFTFSKIGLYYFESEEQNYSRFVETFLKKFNVNLITAKGEDCSYVYELPRMIYHYETVNKEDGHVLANLCRMARIDGVKVLLTGDASDELFGGYSQHNSFLIRSSFHNNYLYRKAFHVLKRLFPNSILNYSGENPAGTDYFTTPSAMNFMEVPCNCLFHSGERLDDWQANLNTYSFVKDKTEQETSAYLMDDIYYRLQRMMIRADRFGMMESVELRLPFLHPSIVKLALNTPLKWRLRKKPFLRGFEGKDVVKRLAIKAGVPRSIVYRRKTGAYHNSTPNMVKVLKHFELKNLSELLKINSSSLRKIVLESLDPALSRIQYSFLSMEILMRIFIENESYNNISEEFRGI